MTARRRPAPAQPSPADSAHDAISRLQERIGYRFHQPRWLLQALTHRSWSTQTTTAGEREDNELLEFLGDAVLGLRASERLLQAYPESSEGQLSRLRAWIVSSRYLAQMAERLDLGAYLRLSPNEERVGGRGKLRLLANALEAMIGAIQRDSGYSSAAAFIDHFVLPSLDALQIGQLHEFAYKSALQEWAHAQGHPLPHYQVVSASGPEHGKTFHVEVAIEGIYRGEGRGATKKAAEQAAAQGALHHFDLLSGRRA